MTSGACGFLIAVFGSSCATRPSPPLPSTARADLDAETAAVVRAEEFVKENGYVAREDGEPAKVVRESCCGDGGDVTAILDRRAGTLLGRACAVIPVNATGDGPGWTVIFCYDPRNRNYRQAIPDFAKWTRERGRAVAIDPEAHLRVVHQDILLHASGSKMLPGMALFEKVLQAEVTERDSVGRP
jgi:hypothetical protein